jgi:hypothetical protein
VSDAYIDALEGNVEAQAEFAEAWLRSLESSGADEGTLEWARAYVRAYEVWLSAADAQLNLWRDAMEGEDVSFEDFRDVWLSAANEAFKEVMSTTAFAATTGGALDSALGLRQGFDEAAESTLHAYGFATEGDIEEIGERLLEFERRQHTVERKLDKVLDAVEG